MFKRCVGRLRSKEQQANSMENGATINKVQNSDVAPNQFLHGKLSIRVLEARNVEGTSSSLLRKVERIVVTSMDGVDPYCSVKIGYNKVMQTSVVQNSAFPVWDAHCDINLCHDLASVDFRVKAAKRPGPFHVISKVKHLSMLAINAVDILKKRYINGWFPLGPYRHEYETEEYGEQTDSESDEDESPRGVEHYGEIHIELNFIPTSDLIRNPQPTVPDTYFPLRQNVNVTMYQDSDTLPGVIPQIPFHPEFKHSRCWIELSDAIMRSTELIYVTGWAVWPELVMVRTSFPGDQWSGITLGEMLKQKAEEGVCVCVMVWDELASNMFSSGLMGTHDEEVVSYFRRSKVNAIKVSRQNPKEGPLADLNDAVMFTHHQKSVIVTRSDPDTGRHRVEAWVGGLDLTDGRYDNQHHPLFRTLQSMHAPPDYYQHCIAASEKSGPREPWHDIHSHITGAAAWDVLENFESRWIRQAPRSMRSKLHMNTKDLFVQQSEEEELGTGSWNVQVLRSINETSTTLLADHEGLIVRRSAATDQSIHNAYIHHIRCAKHFIYLENQYFIGSSHLWDSGQRGGFAANLVPIELAEKICAKIRANERFVVYLTIPMFPEGPPESTAVQEILSHQRKSIALISSRITRTIRETGSDTSLSDWFNVFCLVNRESVEGGEDIEGTTILEKRLRETRRFMVYVHSKFAVFDDAIAIIGSANINSRSLDGSRDTEIAISAWQPEYLSTGSTGYNNSEEEPTLPKGDIAAFRASVWSEHLDGYLDEFAEPNSFECISKIRKLAKQNWYHYASEDEADVTDMPHGHLALYPYEFDSDTGEVSTVQVAFPDYPTALIKGRANPGIPNMLTG